MFLLYAFSTISNRTFALMVFIFYEVHTCYSIDWRDISCAGDDIEDVPTTGSMGVPHSRFRWLGVVQHKFYLAEDTQFAITQGVLIHPGYVLAPAEDIGKIPHENFANTTDFIVWGNGGEKYVLDLFDYILHPDYVTHVTAATVALLQLTKWANGHRQPPVDPICLPLKGMGTFDNLFVIKLNDDVGELNKEIIKMYYVVDKECSEFYYRAQLSYDKMTPQYPLCATVVPPEDTPLSPCIWDNGALLVARLSESFWTLLGYGVRGPGCGAPARFVGMHRMLEWVDASITKRPFEDLPEDSTAFFLRQLSPYELHLYKMDFYVPTEYGMCDRGHKNARGSVMYKDATEILCNKNIGSGFFFVAVYNIAQFTCARVKFETYMRTYTALWVEHHCMTEQQGQALGALTGFPDKRKFECFLYFKSTAFVEFRYTFSFKAFVEMSLYGIPFHVLLLNPWYNVITTDEWDPTDHLLADNAFSLKYFSQWE